MPLQTDITIRPYTLDDVPAAYEAIITSVKEIQPFMPWCHPGYTLHELRTWVETQIAQRQASNAFEFVMVARDGELVGGCGLNTIDWDNRRANLGYWVRSSATRRGVATTATRLLARWGFEHTTLNRLELIISTRNLASLRVATKAGAVREGILRSRLLLHGETHDAEVLSFIRRDVETA
ncbi:MAG: GNAT family N-acetyltransferase [Deltaproteobacteria bacterium]|nr:GNAT family N-acetyltransferase [Deltaproteobacteria bacterium]